MLLSRHPRRTGLSILAYPTMARPTSFRWFVGFRHFGAFVAILFVALASVPVANAQSPGEFYFWVDFIASTATRPRPQSFVIEVDSVKKAEIEALRSQGKTVGFTGRVEATAVSYNRNYYLPMGTPAWNWHVASVNEIRELHYDPFGDTTIYLPRDGSPSDIESDPEQWVQEYGGYVGFERYAIRSEIDPAQSDAVVNVSNRGVTGTGEKTLITGLIIAGGEPRNVVVRALGPSLMTKGVQQAASNPKIAVYRGSTVVASNADWRADARANSLHNSYPALIPENEKEAAFLLTLLPGAYTLHGLNEDGTEGVILLEAYDVDARTQ